MLRTIRKTVTGTTQYDGAGVRLVRVIGHDTVEDFDPFLMMDAFDSEDPDDYIKGFPWHPHRGIETITYLISGDIEHGDSIGNSGSILDGCCQWMTAGRGILHQEMPKPVKRMLGAQLWLNLPRKDKMTQPKYRDLRADMIPKVEEEGSIVRIISGEYREVSGPESGDYVKLLYLDVSLQAGAKWSLHIPNGNTLFVYIVEGDGWFDKAGKSFQPSKTALLFGKGDEFFAKAAEEGMRCFLLCAKPLKEPVAWGGPIVMNTREELNKAFDDLKKGTFI